MLVVVAGVPGSGKTTLARELAPALGLPLLSKDTIQEALMDSLGSGELRWVQRLSRASHLVMQSLVPDVGNAVLEAHFRNGTAEPELTRSGHELVQVYCRCPVEIAWARYQQRRSDPARHSGHRPEHQDESATSSWRTSEPEPLALAAPLIEVDTLGPVDIAALVTEIRAHLAAAPGERGLPA